MKTCKQCNADKDAEEFKKDNKVLDGRSNICKLCFNAKKRMWRKNNPEKAKEKDVLYRQKQTETGYRKRYYTKNRDELRANGKENYLKNRSDYLERAKNQRKNGSYKQYQKQYREKNKSELNRKSSERFRNNPKLRMLNNIRGRVRSCIKWKKKDRTLSYVGCTAKDFMDHIEKQFHSGMTWQNMGPHWHLDHIVPVNAFMFDDESDIYKCFNYTNYQPMLASDNLSKQDLIEEIGIPAKTLKKDLTSYKKWRESLNEN